MIESLVSRQLMRATAYYPARVTDGQITSRIHIDLD